MTLNSRLVNLAGLARQLVESALVSPIGGSVSLRWEDQCYISPREARLDRLSAADFIPLKVEDGPNSWQIQRASAVYPDHLACYHTRPDAATVLHLQLTNSTALGCAGLELGALTPDFYRVVGPAVPLLPYLPPGSSQSAEAIGTAIAGHNAVLLRNQGIVVISSSSDEAFVRCQVIEKAAHVVLWAHAATGNCSFLSPQQMAELD
ncbi:MAG: class II aldolase/adducin family protein [Anaerolineae bacterium]